MENTTDYVVWYYDPRGAWRQASTYPTLSTAKKAAAEIGATDWYIEKRVRSVVFQHYSGTDASQAAEA